MVTCPITLWQIDGEKMETVRNFNFLGPQITADVESAMVNAAMKLKDSCSLEEKLWPT